jgi:acyl-CoA thioesterase FadM
MSELFEKHFEVGWRDVDPNGHVANMAYLGYAVDTRVAFFDSCGFPPQDFHAQGFGPAIKTDFAEYFREVMMLEKLTVTMENGGFAEDGSRFRVINNIYKADRILAVPRREHRRLAFAQGTKADRIARDIENRVVKTAANRRF